MEAMETVELSGVAMAVEPEFTFAAMSAHIPDVLQLFHHVLPKFQLSRRSQRRGLAALFPSAMAIVYVELVDVLDQLDIMCSPSLQSSAATFGMAAT